jgi:hypothetical protein
MKHMIGLTTGALALIVGSAASAEDIGHCNPKQAEFGGMGGEAFLAVAPETLQLRTGELVDALIINGEQHGGDGGEPTGSLELADGEYISALQIRHGAEVDMLRMTTNHGRTIGGGGAGGTETNLFNIRVLMLGGRSGERLDRVQVNYCENYR